ncbi:hypothetical protein PPL_02947 [Heterostelium album PN500]|uniref:Uncharacterized protein n=1 Tax=Heterostelium pallidum (strain ATCC 26659 / Pp 5 / PN500) TaxID=670386 RepID=D3B3H9_HETP5|nr:hypothetical protein PPL_02947 [Heterostelium album PN500]EFA83877.1 hypothetical protein PPL_02947 [Heterostelium album PN500]|eukprot:XP_020435994.1 hypothetical protein PPL_02947 [Heterostelium album PN500]
MSMLDDSNTVLCVTKVGSLFEFDTSFESCSKYGFFNGDLVETTSGQGLVVGVRDNQLWFEIFDHDGASYWDNGYDYHDLVNDVNVKLISFNNKEGEQEVGEGEETERKKNKMVKDNSYYHSQFSDGSNHRCNNTTCREQHHTDVIRRVLCQKYLFRYIIKSFDIFAYRKTLYSQPRDAYHSLRIWRYDYHNIVDANWMITNGHFGLLADKIRDGANLSYEPFEGGVIKFFKNMPWDIFKHLFPRYRDEILGEETLYETLTKVVFQFGRKDIAEYLQSEFTSLFENDPARAKDAFILAVSNYQVEMLPFCVGLLKDKCPIPSNCQFNLEIARFLASNNIDLFINYLESSVEMSESFYLSGDCQLFKLLEDPANPIQIVVLQRSIVNTLNSLEPLVNSTISLDLIVHDSMNESIYNYGNTQQIKWSNLSGNINTPPVSIKLTNHHTTEIIQTIAQFHDARNILWILEDLEDYDGHGIGYLIKTLGITPVVSSSLYDLSKSLFKRDLFEYGHLLTPEKEMKLSDPTDKFRQTLPSLESLKYIQSLNPEFINVAFESIDQWTKVESLQFFLDHCSKITNRNTYYRFLLQSLWDSIACGRLDLVICLFQHKPRTNCGFELEIAIHYDRCDIAKFIIERITSVEDLHWQPRLFRKLPLQFNILQFFVESFSCIISEETHVTPMMDVSIKCGLINSFSYLLEKFPCAYYNIHECLRHNGGEILDFIINQMNNKQRVEKTAKFEDIFSRAYHKGFTDIISVLEKHNLLLKPQSETKK